MRWMERQRISTEIFDTSKDQEDIPKEFEKE